MSNTINESAVVINRNEGWVVLMKRPYAVEKLKELRQASGKQISEKIAIILIAAQHVKDLSRDKAVMHIQLAERGASIVEERDTAIGIPFLPPTPDWDVPCYVVNFYSNVSESTVLGWDVSKK